VPIYLLFLLFFLFHFFSFFSFSLTFSPLNCRYTSFPSSDQFSITKVVSPTDLFWAHTVLRVQENYSSPIFFEGLTLIYSEDSEKIERQSQWCYSPFLSPSAAIGRSACLYTSNISFIRIISFKSLQVKQENCTFFPNQKIIGKWCRHIIETGYLLHNWNSIYLPFFFNIFPSRAIGLASSARIM